ncbi:MAG TPA: hypothetical protein VD973_15875 [Symbiobacteriaceae bacterium]|nr:hypothetical protein [Symbiobacteriaceae bacterium]
MHRSVFILASDPTHEKILLLPDGNLPVIRFAPGTRLDIWETAFFQRLADDQVGAGCWVLSVHDPSDDLIIVTVECRAPGAHQTWVAADAAAPTDPAAAAAVAAWRSYGTQQTLEDLLRLTAAWEPICHAYADAEWVEAYLQHSPVAELDPDSYLTWAIRRRQFYWVKSFRKLLR